MRYWQVLPVGPVEERFGFSPYASPSTFAGNWMFVSLERLAEEPWFPGSPGPDPFEESHLVPFEDIVRHRVPILTAAEQGFFTNAPSADKAAFERFCNDEKRRGWTTTRSSARLRSTPATRTGPGGTGRSRSAIRRRSHHGVKSSPRRCGSRNFSSSCSSNNGRASGRPAPHPASASSATSRYT